MEAWAAAIDLQVECQVVDLQFGFLVDSQVVVVDSEVGVLQFGFPVDSQVDSEAVGLIDLQFGLREVGLWVVDSKVVDSGTIETKAQ